MPGSVEDLPSGRPAHHDCCLTLRGQARREATCQRHGVDLGWAFVARGEGYRLAVWGYGGVVLFRRMTGQHLRHAAAGADLPEVPVRREDDGVAVDRWVTVIA